MSNEPKSKREKSEAEILTFPQALLRDTFLMDTTQLNGLQIRKVLHTRVAKGREQYKQTVTFNFDGCTLATLAEYAITALVIDYQDGCRGDEPFWNELEAYLSSTPEVTVNVADGVKGRRNAPAVSKMSDEDLARVFKSQIAARGSKFAEMLKG